MKKLISILLTLCTLITMIPYVSISAIADEVIDSEQTLDENYIDIPCEVTDGEFYDALQIINAQMTSEENGDSVLLNIVDSLIKKGLEKGEEAQNPYAAGASSVMLVLYNELFSEDESGKELEAIEKTMKKIEELSEKIGKNHNEISKKLEGIDIKIESLAFNQAVTDLNTKNKNATSFFGYKDNNEVKILESGDKTEINALYDLAMSETVGRGALKNEQSSVVAQNETNANHEGYKELYQNCVKYFSTYTAYKPGYILAYQKYSNLVTDAETGRKNFKMAMDYTMNEICVAYLNLTAGLKAREKYAIYNNEAQLIITNCIRESNELFKDLKTAVTAYAQALKLYNNFYMASVKAGSGQEQYYGSFYNAWKAANEAMKNSEITFTLYQDWHIKADSELWGDNYSRGFAVGLTGSPIKSEGFTEQGEIYVNGKVTVNLNGHCIDGDKFNLDIFVLTQNASITVNSLDKSQLKEGQTQGLFRARRALFYNSGNADVNISFNNVDISEMSYNAIYIDGGKSVKLNINGSKISKTEQSSVYFQNEYNFEMNNCEFSDNKSPDGGAAIHAKTNGWNNSIIKNCTFTNNHSSKDGGAIYGAVCAENCTFTGNVSDGSGGAFYCFETMKNCTFENNRARVDGGAAVIDFTADTTDCTFKNNVCDRDGGAVYALNGFQNFTNCKFISNKSTNGYGGAFYCRNTSGVLDGCTFEYNSADNYCGGALNVNDSSVDFKIKNTTFNKNTAGKNGGAVNSERGAVLCFENCTLNANYAKGLGGGVFLVQLYSSYHTISNTTITNNRADVNGGGVYCRKRGLKTADFYASGNTVISNNSVNGSQNNIFLEQKGGVKKCIVDTSNLDANGSSFGITSDSSSDIAIVFNAKDGNYCFGDNGRSTYRSGSDIRFDAQ